MRKGAEGALAGILALGAFGSAQEAKAASKAVAEWWISSKSISDSTFYIPEHLFNAGSTNYLYVATDTTQVSGTSFAHVEWSIQTPVFAGKSLISFIDNYFTTNFYDSAWNGYALDPNSSITKIDQTVNASGIVVNNKATIKPSTTGFSNVSTNFPSASQGGLLASYEWVVPYGWEGLSSNFTLNVVNGIIFTDTTSKNWDIAPDRNLTVAGNAVYSYSDFTVSSGAVPELNGAALLLSGGAALAFGTRRRKYDDISGRLQFDKKGKYKGINRE